MVRLAIHAADIVEFSLPPQTIKKSDSRAASFEKRFGPAAATVELDALPAAELRNRIETAVAGLIDPEAWKRQITVQEVELRCIEEFADRVKNLSQVNPGGDTMSDAAHARYAPRVGRVDSKSRTGSIHEEHVAGFPEPFPSLRDDAARV